MGHLICYDTFIGSEVSFMYKKRNVFFAAVGAVIMLMIGLLFGFTDMEMPKWACMAVWVICLAVIHHGVQGTALER